MAKYKIIPSSRTIVQSPISIGHKAEKGVEAIEFDLTAWVETYGSGTATIVMKRWGDSIPYPVALEIDENNKATWTLSDTDTAKAGMAYAQLSYIVGDEVVKKSDIYTFRVMDSLVGEGEPPEAYESWLEHLTHFAAEAMAEALDIEDIPTDKTLTIDGGIADAKTVGDALALKADKSTTYTKTEVDEMIENVEVETDTTLEIAGAPADAAETGRQIGLLKADLSAINSQALIVNMPDITLSDWEEGTIASGGDYNSPYAIRSKFYYAVNDCSIKFTGVVSDEYNRYCYPVFYDANHNYLYRYTSWGNEWYTPRAADGDVKYVRFIYGFPNASAQTVENYGFENLVNDFSMDIRNEYMLGIKNSIKFMQDGEVSESFDFTSNKYINNADGDIVSNSNYHATSFIPIEPHTNFIDTNCKGSVTGTDGYAFYDTEKTFIEGGHCGRFGITRIKVPDGAKYIRLSSRVSYEESGVDRYVNCVSYVQHKMNTAYTVVMLGDSLIGNYDSETSVPHMLEDFSGAICHNCAFGGSNLGTDTVGDVNQLLLPFRGFKVIESIATNNYSDMDSAIASDPNFNTLIDYYPYHVQKLKDMDWNKVDIIIMSWGTNDWGTSVSLDNTENLKDTNTVAGALRTALETLWSVYPHIKVMICGPIWRGGTITDGNISWDSDTHTNSVGLYLKEYSNTLENVAKEYHVPFVVMYDYTNINGHTWKNYFPVTGSNATHPNAKGRFIMAKRYARFLAEI